MIKANRLKKGDKIAIVSLSKGLLGESFVQHNLDIGIKRLRDLGLEPICMDNTLKGIDFLEANPDKRADDLIQAFRDDTIKGIICAIGGNDTYKTLPYLLDNKEFLDLVISKPKIFTGFSDTTINHLMFYKLGLTTYYGMSLITDLGEISNHMLPYTEKYFNYYLADADEYKKIRPSDIWYDERKDFSTKSLGIDRVSHEETKGYELIQGKPIFEGQLLGGCIDSLYDMLTPYTHSDEPQIIKKYGVFPSLETWNKKILFIETSEIKEKPETFKKMLLAFKEKGIFNVINGVIFGKPQDEVFYDEYKDILINVVADNSLPILFNVNFGHATPRCVLPIGIKVRVDSNKQEIEFLESPFAD